MASEIYNNLNVKKASHIDQRLMTVSTVSDLPDATDSTAFLYIGALVYVQSEDDFYKLDSNSAWVKLNDSSATGVGVLNVASGTSSLDLAIMSNPTIDKCDTVLINISGGTSLNVVEILNFPSDREITFQVETNKTITFNHTDYSAAGANDIVLEDGFNMTITGRVVGNESVTFKKNSNTVVQHSAVQFMNAAQWAQNILSIAITDNVTSTSTSSALSANQGRVLKELIDTKEIAFNKGEGLSYDSTSSTLNVIPWSWSKLSTPSASIDLSTPADFQSWLSNLSGVVSPNTYRYVIANNGVNDRGVWMIPPGADPSSYANWILFSAGDPVTAHAEYSIFADTTPGSSLITNSFHPAIVSNIITGDAIPNFATNVDGNPTNKISFGFNQTGLYQVVCSVTLNAADQASYDELSKGVLNFVITDGVQSAANPTNTGFIYDTTPFSHVHVATSGAQEVKALVRATMDVQSVGVNNAFTFTIATANGTAVDWTDITLGTHGKLTITKLR